MALQKERGVNPLAGCLPIVPQIPIFIGLLHVLRWLAPGVTPDVRLDRRPHRLGLEGQDLRVAPISASFNMTEPKKSAILGLPGSPTSASGSSASS